jgi:hypothetical protein
LVIDAEQHNVPVLSTSGLLSFFASIQEQLANKDL